MMMGEYPLLGGSPIFFCIRKVHPMARREYIQRRNPPVQPSRRRSYRKKAGPPPLLILIAVLLVAVIVGIIIFAVSSGKKNDSDTKSTPSSTVSSQTSSTDESSAGEASAASESSPAAEPTAAPTPEAGATTPPEQIPVGTPEQLDSLVRIGDTAFEYYNFVEESANDYITAIADSAKTMPAGTTFYDMIIPTSMDITLSEEYIDKYGINSSNQQKAINYIYSSINAMNPAVKTVDLFTTLKQHNNDYIYFRTDHHWTQLGAYYAYVEFCKAKGVTPKALTDFDTASYPGFLGSFYNDSPNAEMEANPDTVEAYIPRGDIHMNVTQADGEILEDWPVVQDGTNYDDTALYLIYAAGDQPYEEIHNNDITDGSSCVLVKESFGNCFVPFLASQYQTVYVIDYRHYPGDISDLVAEKGIQDVICLNNISMTRNASLISDLTVTF